MPQQSRLYIGWQQCTQFVGLVDPKLHRCGRIRDDERAQSGRAYHGVLGSEHAAPTLTKQVVTFFDIEMTKQVGEFVDKQGNLPEIGSLVGKVHGAPGPELIIVDDGAISIGERCETEEIIVGKARTPM